MLFRSGKIALVIVGVILAISAVFFGVQQEAAPLMTFQEYKLTYGLSYAGQAEETFRQHVFEENVRKIQ